MAVAREPGCVCVEEEGVPFLTAAKYDCMSRSASSEPLVWRQPCRFQPVRSADVLALGGRRAPPRVAFSPRADRAASGSAFSASQGPGGAAAAVRRRGPRPRWPPGRPC